MKSNGIINKIKIYSVVSFLLPLLAINSCLLVYKFLGNIDVYRNINWGEKKIEIAQKTNNFANFTYLNCPKYKYDEYVVTVDNKPVIIYEQGEIINYRCIKNHKYLNLILSNFSFLEKILLKALKNNPSGFSSIKNPYFYGEISISRTARYFPATFIFKPFIILSAFFLFFYWRNNLNLFNELKNNNASNRFSKSFFYLGVLSCIFLTMHASLLGLDFDSKLFSKIRRLIIILFILFELSAQILLTRNLYKFRSELKKNIRYFIIYVKVTFVIIVFSGSLILFAFLVWGNISSEVKHIFEWNYFSILCFYYLLSRLLWKS